MQICDNRAVFHAFARRYFMPVLHLTIFISILLAVVFIICFVMEAWRNKNQGIEQTSLLPLADDEADDDADIYKMIDEGKKGDEENPNDDTSQK